jgi:hypothetical protein
VRKIKRAKKIREARYDEFDMSSKENREAIVKRDWNIAKETKSNTTEELKILNDYYNSQHQTKLQIELENQANGNNIHYPVLPDCFKVVEQSIDNNVPGFMFSGRDVEDNKTAKEREDMVNYVVYNNSLESKMPENERNLGKSKNAFWKVYWDKSAKFGEDEGDIKISNPSPANIFPDPSAYTIDDCEFLIYAFRIHKKKARRIFGEIIDELNTDNKYDETEIFNTTNTYANDGTILYEQHNNINHSYDQTLQVLEYWFRQYEDGSKNIDGIKYNWKAGDVACSIVIDNTEVKYIPNYWVNTKIQCYPFIKYCRVPNTQSFWDKSDIEIIIDMVEAGDRELNSTLMNNQFHSNDNVVVEEEAMADGSEISNHPGDVYVVRQGKLGAIKRLGGITNSSNELNVINWIQNQIEEMTGNQGINSGEKPPTNVTTFSGMALLAEQGQKRIENKKTDRNEGFKKLFELIDYHVMEFYQEDRYITIRGKDGNKKMFNFNSNNYKMINEEKFKKEITENMTDEEYYNTREKNTYYPRMDTEIILTDPVSQSRAMTIQATSEIMKSLDNLTPIKAKLLKSQIELMGLSNKGELIEAIDETLKQQEEQLMQQQSQQNTNQMQNNMIRPVI